MPSASPAPAGDEGDVGEPQKRQRRPFSIHNACAESVTLALGDDANAPEGGVRTLGPHAGLEGARHPDGKQTVWLLDDQRSPLVKVHVTRGMKTVEVGRSCRTLDAR